MTNTAAARDIKANIAADIRRCAPAHTRITMAVALHNWNYFFAQGRDTEARAWWAIVHEFIIGAR